MQPFIASKTGLEAASLMGKFLVAFGVLGWVAWLGAIGMFLNRRNRPSKSGPARFFQFALGYTALYLVALDVFVSGTSPLVRVSGAEPMSTFRTLNFYFTLPLVAILCALYAFYFAAKNLAMAEKSGPVKFRDYAGPLLLIWFFPLGVWFVQPGINRLYAQSKAPRAGAGAAALQ